MQYDSHLLIGDFNSEPTELAICNFYEIYNTKNIMKEKMCSKNPENLTCVDLILTKRPRSFQNLAFIETGLSVLHKMSVTEMKVYYFRQKPSAIFYRKFKFVF